MLISISCFLNIKFIQQHRSARLLTDKSRESDYLANYKKRVVPVCEN